MKLTYHKFANAYTKQRHVQRELAKSHDLCSLSVTGTPGVHPPQFGISMTVTEDNRTASYSLRFGEEDARRIVKTLSDYLKKYEVQP